MNSDLTLIGERLRTQDNRATAEPMFCVQKKVRDIGYDVDYAEGDCWVSYGGLNVVFEEPDETEGWAKYGYKDRWETVMVAFTERGCQEYLELNGHNVRRSAHNGEVRIYVESFRRCHEMIAIRKALMEQAAAVVQDGDVVEMTPNGPRPLSKEEIDALRSAREKLMSTPPRDASPSGVCKESSTTAQQ